MTHQAVTRRRSTTFARALIDAPIRTLPGRTVDATQHLSARAGPGVSETLIELLKREIRYEFACEGPPEGFPKFPDIPRSTDPAFLDLALLDRPRAYSRAPARAIAPRAVCRT